MSEIACICFSIRAVIGIHFSERPTSGSSTNDKFRAIHDLFGQKYLSLAGLTRNNFRNARCDHPSETLALMPSAPRRKRTARTDRLRHCAILLTGSYPAQSNSRASSSAVQGRKAGRELRLGDSGRRTAWRRSSLTDTSDTVLRGNPGNERNHRNSSQRSNLLVTRSNTGYYGISIGFTGTRR